MSLFEEMKKLQQAEIEKIKALPDTGPFGKDWKEKALKDAETCLPPDEVTFNAFAGIPVSPKVPKMASTATLQKGRVDTLIAGLQKGSSVTGVGNNIAGQDAPKRAKWRE